MNHSDCLFCRSGSQICWNRRIDNKTGDPPILNRRFDGRYSANCKLTYYKHVLITTTETELASLKDPRPMCADYASDVTMVYMIAVHEFVRRTFRILFKSYAGDLSEIAGVLRYQFDSQVGRLHYPPFIRYALSNVFCQTFAFKPKSAGSIVVYTSQQSIVKF